MNKVYDSRNDCNAIIKTNKLIAGCNSTSIPKSITTIENNAFFGLKIESMIIPENVKEIGPWAFACCEKLEMIQLPNSLKVISHHLFNGCTSLKSIEIPENVEIIERKSFGYCESLKSLFIPKNVNFIQENPLLFYNNVELLKVDSSNKIYDSRNDCNAIIETKTNNLIVGCKSTIIPDSVEIISENAFSYCINLKSITIPKNVIKVLKGAFEYCENLESVNILNEKTIIEDNAFAYCKKLKYFIIDGKRVSKKKFINK